MGKPVDIEQYIIDNHVKIIDGHLGDKDFENALEALGRLAEFYLGCFPEQKEREDWQR